MKLIAIWLLIGVYLGGMYVVWRELRAIRRERKAMFDAIRKRGTTQWPPK